MKKLLILGSGTGGTILTNRFFRKLDSKEWIVTVIDKSTEHFYQPGFLFLPFKLYGYETKEDVAKPIREPLPKGIDFVNDTVRLIDHKNNSVETENGKYDYDMLIIALGAEVSADEVEGLTESFGPSVNTFYNFEGAMALQESFENFREGKVVVNIAEMPIKCPVAPIEFVFLADYFFHQKGIRDRIEIELVTPLTGAFTKPKAKSVLGAIAKEKHIKIIPNFPVGSIDTDKKIIESFTGEKVE
jgi:sulfide:quinone oxidoreductase